MFSRVLILLLLISCPLSVHELNASEGPSVHQALIRSIVMEGFVLEDKEQFVKLFKPYRNKYLSLSDMDEILDKVKVIYEREGYQELVSITYHVKQHRLVFTALMVS